MVLGGIEQDWLHEVVSSSSRETQRIPIINSIVNKIKT